MKEIKFLDIGLRIESCMKAKNLSQAELARETGISPPDINRYVKGQMRPSGDNLLTLTKYFKTSQEWLYTGEGPPPDIKPGDRVREDEEKYSKEGIADSNPNKVSLLQSDIKDLEDKLDDKQKIIELLEAENIRLKQENADLKGKLKDGTNHP